MHTIALQAIASYCIASHCGYCKVLHCKLLQIIALQSIANYCVAIYCGYCKLLRSCKLVHCKLLQTVATQHFAAVAGYCVVSCRKPLHTIALEAFANYRIASHCDYCNLLHCKLWQVIATC